MNFTQQLLSELFKKARNFQTVRVSNITQGNTININLGYGSVRVQALTNLSEGDAVVFQTDQGNWYVIGSGNNITSGVTNTRQIIYRAVSRPKRKLVYPVKTLRLTGFNDNIGFAYVFDVLGDEPARRMKGGFKEYRLFDLEYSIVNLGEGDEYIVDIQHGNYPTDTPAKRKFIFIDKNGKRFNLETNLNNFIDYWVNRENFLLQTHGIWKGTFIKDYEIFSSSESMNTCVASWTQRILDLVQNNIANQNISKDYTHIKTPGNKSTTCTWTSTPNFSCEHKTVFFNDYYSKTTEDISLDYDFLSFGDTILHHTVKYKKEIEIGFGAEIAGPTTFWSYIKGDDSITLKRNNQVIKDLNTGNYFAFPITTVSDDLADIQTQVDEPFAANLFYFDPFKYNSIQGCHPVYDGALPAQMPNGWQERESYDPTKYIGKNVLCFFSKTIEGKEKQFYGRGTINSITLANRFNFRTNISVTLTEVKETGFDPISLTRNFVMLDNGSFYSFFYSFLGYDYQYLKVVCPEIIKIALFSKDLGFCSFPSRLGETTPLANDWHFSTTYPYVSWFGANIMVGCINLMRTRCNIIKNKIYCTSPIQKNNEVENVGVAQWNITDDGKILFEKTFIVDYEYDARVFYPQNSSYYPPD